MLLVHFPRLGKIFWMWQSRFQSSEVNYNILLTWKSIKIELDEIPARWSTTTIDCRGRGAVCEFEYLAQIKKNAKLLGPRARCWAPWGIESHGGLAELRWALGSMGSSAELHGGIGLQGCSLGIGLHGELRRAPWGIGLVPQGSRTAHRSPWDNRPKFRRTK